MKPVTLSNSTESWEPYSPVYSCVTQSSYVIHECTATCSSLHHMCCMLFCLQMKWVQDLNALVTCSLDGTVQLVDIDKQRATRCFTGHSHGVHAVDYCAHHKFMVSAGMSREVRQNTRANTNANMNANIDTSSSSQSCRDQSHYLWRRVESLRCCCHRSWHRKRCWLYICMRVNRMYASD